jgi:hypothetical protein
MKNHSSDRARQMLAQEAARIIVEQGIQDFRIAKTKAAERLSLKDRGSLPGNAEIELAVSNHLQLFGRESHLDLLRMMRHAALAAMEMLSPISAQLVGPVLNGTAAENSSVNLHVFADDAETVAFRLQENAIRYKPFERRLKCHRNRLETFAAFRFLQDESPIEATVFPIDGVRQAPISPVDGKPMRRADRKMVLELLAG